MSVLILETVRFQVIAVTGSLARHQGFSSNRVSSRGLLLERNGSDFSSLDYSRPQSERKMDSAPPLGARKPGLFALLFLTNFSKKQ